MTYADEVLADSPLVYLKLDETSGSTAADSSGNGRSLTIGTAVKGQASLLPSGVGTCFDFDTTSDALQRASEAWMKVNTCTIEAWINPDSVTGFRCVGGRDPQTFTSGGPRGPVLYVRDGALSASGVSSTGTISVGTTYLVAATWSGTTITFYINGAPAGSSTVTALRNDEFNAPLTVGASYATASTLNFPFDGRIDEFAFYGTALSPTRIADHYAAANPASSLILDETLPPLTETITLRSFTDTDTSNQVAGITIVGSSIEPDNTDPVILPAAQATRRDKALWYPTPDLVDGRPT